MSEHLIYWSGVCEQAIQPLSLIFFLKGKKITKKKTLPPRVFVIK